ncbi:MAG: secretin and TonB N-terminal domain-containing protein [Candidatus Omnitrophica bacterium]|nr:secretin and TonB N-terminal domain-containing protein [Candidatus Omnitrophota bacterium]
MKNKISGLFIFACLFGCLTLNAHAAVDAAKSAAGTEISDSALQMNAEGLITVDFSNADIQSVLKVLALKGDVNIVASPDVQGKVNIQLKDVPWASALETIVETYGFRYEKKDNIYQVFTAQAMEERQEEVFNSEVFTLKYAELDQVAKALKNALSPAAVVEPVAGSNQIIVTDTADSLEVAKNIVARIDYRMPQVHIETKIVRTTLSKGENLGIDWNPTFQVTGSKRPTTFPFSENADNRPFDRFLRSVDGLPQGQTNSQTTATQTSASTTTTSSTDFPNTYGFPFVDPEEFTFGTIDFSQFSAVFNMLKNRRSTKIISNPRIVVMNHQSAQIQVGEEVGIPTLERNESTGSFEVTGFEQRNTGIVLQVTPHIVEKKEVLLRVRPEVSQFLGFEAITDTNLTSPRFETIMAETTVLINSGDTLVIGGLISEEEADNRNRVPVVSRIPVVGWLFKSKNPTKSRTETIFFITVTLADDVYNQKALEEWKKSQKDFADYQKESEEDFNGKKNGKKNSKK